MSHRFFTFFVILLVLGASLGCEGTLEMADLEDEVVATDTQAVTSVPQPTVQPVPTTPEAPVEEPAAPLEEPVVEEPPEDPEPEEPTRPEPGTIVEFEILQGTSDGAWNAKDSAVVVYVGQILRVTNFDDRDHQIHGSDSAPIDHGSRFSPGQTVDIEVKRAVALGDSARNWDHGDGRLAEFWIDSRE